MAKSYCEEVACLTDALRRQGMERQDAEDLAQQRLEPLRQAEQDQMCKGEGET